MTERSPSTASEVPSKTLPLEPVYRRMIIGFLLGALIGMGTSLLGINRLLHIPDVFLLFGIVGGLIGRTRLRKCLWILAVLTLIGLLSVGYTPLVPYLMHTLEREDPLQKTPAIVVLSAYVQKAQTLDAIAQARVLHAYLLLRQGYADRLVLTHSVWPYGSQIPIVRKQMETLGLDYPIDNAGEVADTHDEAVAVARLAHERQWERVILVTSPWHMRRAAGVFERSGVKVVCAPCVEGEYDMDVLNRPPGRLRAFADWLHEAIGYQVYRWRGWI